MHEGEDWTPGRFPRSALGLMVSQPGTQQPFGKAPEKNASLDNPNIKTAHKPFRPCVINYLLGLK